MRRCSTLHSSSLSAAIFRCSSFWIPQTCGDRKSTRLNSSHQIISYAVFCLKKKNRDRFTREFCLSDMDHVLANVALCGVTDAPLRSTGRGLIMPYDMLGATVHTR